MTDVLRDLSARLLRGTYIQYIVYISSLLMQNYNSFISDVHLFRLPGCGSVDTGILAECITTMFPLVACAH